MSSAVLQRIAELSEPVSFSGTAWDFLGTSPSVRRYPNDIQLLLTTLNEEFSVEQLQAAKVLRINGEGEPVPTPVFSAFPQSFVCLRRNRNERPYDLLTERGSLLREDPPCFTARRDFHTNSCFSKRQSRLLIVPDVRALAVMRQLNMPASLATGLHELTGNQMRQLCGQPEIVRSHETNSTEHRTDLHLRGTTIVLVAWDVTNLSVEEPSNVKATAVRLAQAAETFGFNTEHIKMWNPPEPEVYKIALAAEFRDVNLVRAAMRLSIKNSLLDLHSYFKETRRPEDCAGARRELIQEIKRARKLNYQTPELAKKREHFVKVFDETYVKPLYASAQSTSDPVARPLLIAAAEITEQLHNSSMLLRVAARAGTRDDDLLQDFMSSDEMKERRQLNDQLIDIRRELRGK